MGPRIGEGPRMPDRSTKTTMGTEDMHERKVSVEPQDSHQDAQPRGMFHNIKFFVLCHSLSQSTQLMISGYLKSSISTVEKRFGSSSQISGSLAAFNEVGNVSLILFVSYFGSRVHRPRMIGYGALSVATAGSLMALPHFISEPYRYDHSSSDNRSSDFEASSCSPTTMAPASASSNGSCSSHTETKHSTMVGIMFAAQTSLGIGGVPIQPFGISYIDDFAHHSNSPLYIGILFGITTMGPGSAYGSGSLMLRLYVDIDRVPEGGINLTPKDPRWVGAWWSGFLISSGSVVSASSPYFFFPREMPKEKHEFHFRRKVLASAASTASKGEDLSSQHEPLKKQAGLAQIAPDLTLVQFVKVFPRVSSRNSRHPIFLSVVSSQVCTSSMVAGMATFSPKFSERQFSITASFANMLLGCLTIPSVIVGIMMGGVLVKRLHSSPVQCSALCLLGSSLCSLFSVPLFFIGCSTHQIAGITQDSGAQPGPSSFPGCSEPCSCQSDDFNPVCDTSAYVEYTTPCHAGCTGRVVQEASGKSQVFYTNCSCVAGNGTVPAGSCESACSRSVSPFIVSFSSGAGSASITHTPSFMLISRGVKKEDKTSAVGMQFMLSRVSAWMPSPVIHGSAIDTTCVHWASTCGRRAVCRYYDHDSLRNRFIGLQFFFKSGSSVCFTLVLAILRQQSREASTRTTVKSSELQQL